MPDNITFESNTPEYVAYKLMVKILGQGARDKKLVLQTYYDCLMVVKGNEPDED